MPARGVYDRSEIDAILDEALVRTSVSPIRTSPM